MNLPSSQTAAARLKKVSPLRPTLAIVLGSGFHHALTELRVDKKIPCANRDQKIQGGLKRNRMNRWRSVRGIFVKQFRNRFAVDDVRSL